MKKLALLIALLTPAGVFSTLPEVGAEAQEHLASPMAAAPVSGHHVTGLVTAQGHAVSDAHISARLRSAGGTYAEVAVTHSDGAGAFALDLPTGTYRFQLLDHDDQYVTEWYADSATEASATAVAVTADLQLAPVELAPATLVSATIGRAPYAGFQLRAFEAYGAGTTPTREAVSDSTGLVQLRLPPGYWKFQVISPSGVSEWVSGSVSFASAPPLRVRGADYDLGYLNLDGARYSGPSPRRYDVTGTMGPESRGDDYRIEVYRDNGESFEYYMTTYDKRPDPLLSLRDGRYKLNAIVRNRFEWWYGGGDSVETSGVLTVSGGPRDVGRIGLRADYPVLSGTVVDSAGRPAAGTTVVAADAGSGEFQALDVADRQGRFVLYRKPQSSDVQPTTWQLRVTSPDRRIGPQYYRGATLAAQATPVVVNGRTTIAAPWVLSRGSSISGRVTDEAGQPLEQIRVTVLDANGIEMAPYPDNPVTGVDGTYTLTGLGPGDYRLGFTDVVQEYDTEWFSNRPTYDVATPFTVGPDQDAVAPDVALHRNGYVPTGVDITGTVTAADGPVAGATVLAYPVSSPGSGAAVAQTTTGRDGVYEFTRLEPQSDQQQSQRMFKIQVVDDRKLTGRLGHVATWFGDGRDFANSPVLTLPLGGTLTGIDVHPVQFGAISGTVTHDGAPELTSVSVGPGVNAAYDITDPLDGSYRVATVEPGAIRVGVDASSLGDGLRGISEWWESSASAARATPVVVQPGQVVSGIDVEVGDFILSRTAPSVLGNPQPGQTLTADPGTWSLTGLTYAYQWLDGDVLLGTGPSYVVKASDAARTITVRVTASATTSVLPFEEQRMFLASRRSVVTAPATEPTAPNPTTAPIPIPTSNPTVPATPTTPEAGTAALAGSRITARAAYQARSDVARVRIRVQVVGLADPGGTVRVTESGRVVRGQLRVVDGRAVLVIRHPSAGRHSYRLDYSGTDLAESARARVSALVG